MPENKKTFSTSEFMAGGLIRAEEPAAKTISTADFLQGGGAQLVDPDKYRTKGLLEEKPEDLKYSVYKAARSIPVIGEIAARAGDYVVGAFDPNRSASEVRAAREAKEMNFEQNNPRLSTIAGFGGAMVSPVPAFGVASEINALRTTGKIGALAKDAAQIGGVATREALIAGTDAAMRGLDGTETAKTAGKTALAIGTAAKAVPAFGRGVAKYGFGINDPRMVAETYAARKAAINSADEANLLDQVIDSADEYRLQNKMADEAVDVARKENAAAKEALRAEIRGTRPPETLAKDVIAAVDSLAAKVSDGSGQAFDILSKSNVEIPLPKIKAFLTQKLRQYQSPNKTFYPGAEAEFAELAQWREYFDKIGGKTARPEDVKGLIQYLDRKTAPIYAKRAGERTLAERDLIDFRRYMDSFLKEDVPGYADAMKSVAKEAALLKDTRKMFDGELRADRTLERIGKPFKEKELQTLKDLSESTGVDLVSPMQEYMSAQRSLTGPAFSQKAEMLPEFGQMKKVEAAREALQNENRFAERFSRNSAQSELKRLRSANQNPIKLREDLQKLSEKTGIDFIQMNNDLAMKEMFEKGYTHGSRNVNLGAISGQALFSAIGNLGSKLPWVGPAIGAVGGSIVDKSGPMLYKAILDMSQTKLYQKSAGAIIYAAERSPQLAAQKLKQALAENPEFQAALQGHVQGQVAADKESRKEGFRIPNQVQFDLPRR